ncbi:E3 ubiquitin-protein ligase, putative [Plasmodium yoelii]|uniref:RING-type E3 ubiquitin transferase n=2 Tax=Plasmodium yoelii TaxID=5861 RepID=Q7RNV6_PLAYO|nr:E3 ubiquitin-protein ligase, putative [Plasmodium yoelii]EAA21073.1 hypothetical protein [Plasmodium yoelii yoelii]CDU16504.1 E3 ubiquitin-protein ligase, putative [Plasmodium yoelii]VTZ73348.1 E3 ubiquitin-protein ligase, putative [Plasmodium yoelii]|eukprot:XP_729508.1 E3 ubiquitin-protein ligase, putative [Plasmodium yoelii]
MDNNVERREGEDGDDSNDVFLYNNETHHGSEFCNILCIFIFFMALFIIMIAIVDNKAPNNNDRNYNSENENISNNLTNDDVINNFLENAVIQSFDFKGNYKIKKKNKIKHEQDRIFSPKNEQGGNIFEGKIVTLKLALQNITKSFLFLHFYPTNVNIKEIKNEKNNPEIRNEWNNKVGSNYYLIYEQRNKKDDKKFEYIGMTGININTSQNYIFNGNGYNISTFCNDVLKENCICNYTAHIKLNTKINQLTSIREIEETYFYSLKKYIIDEQNYFNNTINEKYRKYYKQTMEAVSSHLPGGDIEKGANNIGINNIGSGSGSGSGIDNNGSSGSDGGGGHYQGVLMSNDCDFEVSLEGYDEDNVYFSKKVRNFILMYNLKSLIELGLFYKQIKNSENVRNASKISIITICLNSYIEIFEALILLYQVLFSKLLLTSYMAMIMFKFVLYTLMEIRYILLIWKANNSNNSGNNNWEYMQKQLSILYKYYYGFVLLLIAIFYYIFPYFPYLILFIYLCWVPQICLDIWKGQHKSISLSFVFLLSACRLFLPIYIFMYPYNIFQLDIFSKVGELSNITFSFIIIFCILLQLIFMYIQRIYGPRYLFNINLLPHVHNYYQNLDPNFEAGIQECVICMYNIILNNKKYCITPCYHIFHEKCLQQWMTIKMECPTCRGSLPNFP